MKKTLAALLLLLMLAALLPALAEGGTQTYQNATFGYQMDYSADWLLVDKDTIDTFKQQFTDGTAALEGLTPTALYAMQIAIDQAVPDSLAIWTDMRGNAINVTCSAFPAPADMQQVQLGIAPLLAAMFSAMYTDLEVLNGGSITSYNGRAFLQQEFRIHAAGGSNDITLFCCFQNDLIYSISFTWVSSDPSIQAELAETMEFTMNSFVLVE